MFLLCIVIAIFLWLQLLLGATFIRHPQNVDSHEPHMLLKAAWTGFAAVLIISLAVAATGPVSPVRSAFSLGAACTLSIYCLRRRRFTWMLWRWNTWAVILVCIIVVVCGISASSLAVPSDTGLYHMSAVSWYSEHGIIKGLGLLHIRLAYVSSWFSLAAIFNHGLLRSTPPALPGALTSALLLVQLAAHLRAIWTGVDSWLDRGMVCVLISIGWLTWLGRETFTSPDCGVTALVVVAYWMLADAAVREPKAHFPTEVIIVAAAAATLKPTALLLLLAIAALALFPLILRRQWSACAPPVLALAIPTGILCYATWRASGSILFPSPISSLATSTPWTIPPMTTDLFSSVSREWNRRLLWTIDPSRDTLSPDWLGQWIAYYWTHVASIAGVAAIGVAAAWRKGLPTSDPPLSRPLVYAFVLSLFGTAYWFILGAAPRLGIGYTVLPLAAAGIFSSQRLLALLAATFALLPLWPTVSRTWSGITLILLLTLGTLGIILTPSNSLRYRRPQLTVLLISAFVCLAIGRECAVTLRARIQREGLGMALLVPQHIPATVVRTRTSGELKYFSPATGDLCWAADLPCTPYLTVRQIALQRPEQGVRGGLIIVDPSIPDGFLNANRIRTQVR